MGTLGDTLYTRRRELGMSLADASQATRIRERLLEALEKGEYEALPAPGYVRGYISSYARLLDLDEQQLIHLYIAETGAPRQSRLTVEEPAVVPMHEQHAVPLRTAVIAVGILVALGAGIWLTIRIVSGPEEPPPVPTPVASSTTTPTTPSETDLPTSGSPTTPVPAENLPFTVKIAVASDGASWLDIEVDGTPAYSGKLTGGQSKEFEASEQVVVKMGKPEDVTISRDGEPVAFPKNGKPVTITSPTPE